MPEKLLPHPDTPPPDRSHSIDQRHTFTRGGRHEPNSGPEYNPVLEVNINLPAEELHVEPDVRETPSE